MWKLLPLQVCVPPHFDLPSLSTTHIRHETRISTPYDVLFGKMVLRYLFDNYFEDANRFRTHIKLNQSDDPDDDQFTVLVAGPLEEGIVGDVIYSFTRKYDVFKVRNNIWFSVPGRTCTVKSVVRFPKLGFGVACMLPIISKSSLSCLEDYPVMGVWCDRSNVSAGSIFDPRVGEYPISSAFLLTKQGRITAGVQYQPKFGSKGGGLPFQNLANWSGAISYGSGSVSALTSFSTLTSVSALTPTFHFGLELANKSKLIASFYKHIVVEKSVKTPFEYKKVACGSIRNYIDFGFELETRMNDGKKLSNKIKDSTFQIAASWQFSEHLLVKGKVGPLSSSIALALKSWGQLPLTFSVSGMYLLEIAPQERHLLGLVLRFDTIQKPIGINVDTIQKPRTAWF